MGRAWLSIGLVGALLLAPLPVAAQSNEYVPGSGPPPSNYVPGSGQAPPAPVYQAPAPVYQAPPEPALPPPPPAPTGTPVALVGKSGGSFTVAGNNQSCTTPCTLYFPVGPAMVTVTGPGGTFTQTFPVDNRPLNGEVSAKRSLVIPAILTAGGVLFLGLVVGGVVVRLKPPSSLSASQAKAYGTTFIAAGTVFSLPMLVAGIVLLSLPSKNEIKIGPVQGARLSLAPLLDGGMLVASGRF